MIAAAPATHALAPLGANGVTLSELNSASDTTMKNASTAQLDDDHHEVRLRALPHAADEQQRDQQHDDDRRQVEDTTVLGR